MNVLQRRIAPSCRILYRRLDRLCRLDRQPLVIQHFAPLFLDDSRACTRATAMPVKPAESAAYPRALPRSLVACENAGMRAMVGVLVLVVVACAGDGSTVGLSDERFIETMVELRRAAITAGSDTAQFEQRRQAILNEQGVTEDELRTYVEANSRDLYHMAAVWDSISTRLSELEAR
jgi:hypothetical protein